MPTDQPSPPATEAVADRDLIAQIQRATTPAEVLPLLSALIQRPTAASIPVLIELLHHPNPAVTLLISEALEQLPESIGPLIAGFSSCSDQTAQSYIIRILARVGDPRGLDLLVEMVGVEVANHCQGNVRRLAARGLGKMVLATGNGQKRQAAITKLIWALMNAEDWALRYAAALSLGEINTNGTQLALSQALATEVDPVVRQRILMLLKQPVSRESVQTMASVP